MEKQVNHKKNFRLFIATFVTVSIGVCLFNIYFNVYGLFSDEQFEYKLVHNDRVSKYNWVTSLDTVPECFIMGSSNSMRFIPDTLESITGLESFNFGLFHARAEDYWCMSNALINGMKKPPKLIFFCLDDWNFCDEPPLNDEIFRGAEKRLSFKRQFSQYLDDYSVVKLRWGQLKASLTYEHLQGSWEAFWYLSTTDTANPEKTIAPMTDVFYENGIRKKYGRIDERPDDLTDTCETGTYNVRKYLEEVDSAWKKFPVTRNGILDKSHEKFERFSYRRLVLFERTIALLQKANCKVAINIMPNHPYFRDVIMRETNYAGRLARLKVFLSYLQKKYDNVIVIKDNSDIRNFGGFENHFFDYMHPTSVNSTLMLETYRQELSNYAF